MNELLSHCPLWERFVAETVGSPVLLSGPLPKIIVFNGSGLGKTFVKHLLARHYDRLSIPYRCIEAGSEAELDRYSDFKGFLLVELHGPFCLQNHTAWQTITFDGGLPR
ncbi:MAG: hypothetical protein JW902_12250 [Syntrophaceae bacterium]|nr:hypothetical protein [Syntrophaceae bacterium]